MKFSATTAILVTAAAFLCPYHAAEGVADLPAGGFDVVLRGGEQFKGSDPPSVFRTKRGKKACYVSPQQSGNFVVDSYPMVFGSNHNSFCKSGDGNGQKARFKLQTDGNFVGSCGPVVDYATHTDGPKGDYFLAIDDECILHIFKGTASSDSVYVDKEIWTNVKKEFKVGDRLGKGEYALLLDADKKTPRVLLMQSSDGNLVLYSNIYMVGGVDAVEWAANLQDEYTPPGTRPYDGEPDWLRGQNMKHDFFARVASNGHLTLSVIDYTDDKHTTYLDYDLRSNGATYFTVGYDKNTGRLIAMCGTVPCVEGGNVFQTTTTTPTMKTGKGGRRRVKTGRKR